MKVVRWLNSFYLKDVKHSFFCAGSKYWKFRNREMERGFPQDMSNGFPGIPNNVDAVFVWGGNGKLYFIKDEFFWKFDHSTKPYVRWVWVRGPLEINRDYPRPPSL